MIAVENIPVELRSLERWVTWRGEERQGKETKVPHSCDGISPASTTDPETWCPFDATLSTAQAGRADGIGFVFAREDGYVGVDLDEGLSEADRAAILLALDSYAETSVSGRGAHVIVRASLNGYGRNRHGPFEVYNTGRYFVMTGQHVRGTPTTIEARQAQLEEVLREFLPERSNPSPKGPTRPVDLDDRDLLERAFAARNGSDFRALWEGSAEGYPSRSEADLALCSLLAFWTGRETARMDRLFRASGLMRPKWERQDYRERTLERAVAGSGDVYTPPTASGKSSKNSDSHREDDDASEEEDDRFRLQPLDWDPILERGIPEVEFLSEPYLPARKRIWAVGAAESGKSIWAAYKAAELTRAGYLVAYVSQENGLDEEVRRFLRLRPDFEHLRLCVDQGLDLVESEHVDALLELANGAALLVLDTLSACWSGEEDSNRQLAAFDREVMKRILTETGASPLVLDHTGNPQAFVRRRGVSAPRGASSKGQKTDYLLEFRDLGNCEFRIEHGKGRGGGKRAAARRYRVVDLERDGESLLDLVEIEDSDEEKVSECADALVEKIIEAGELITKAVRAAAKELGYGAEITSAALERMEHEDPARVTCRFDTIDTVGGRQRAKVWRPVAGTDDQDSDDPLLF